MTATDDGGDLSLGFNFRDDDYEIGFGVGFDAGVETPVAQDGDMADTESNADGEYEIDDVSFCDPPCFPLARFCLP
jgi:hypothetical protein